MGAEDSFSVDTPSTDRGGAQVVSRRSTSEREMKQALVAKAGQLFDLFDGEWLYARCYIYMYD